MSNRGESLLPRTEARVLRIPSLKDGEDETRPDLTSEQIVVAERVQGLVNNMARSQGMINQMTTQEKPQPAMLSLLPRIDPQRESRVILIDGESGSGKTSVLLTLIDLWNRRLLLQDTTAEPGPPVPIFPIGVLDLQPLPPSTNLVLHVASTLRKIIERVEGGPGSGTATPPWHPVRQQEGNSATAAWREFLRAAAAGSDSSLQQRHDLDPEAFILELEQTERERLDIARGFFRLVKAVVKDLANWSMIPGTQPPFLILSIDGADMNPHFSVALLNLLRILYHPRLAYLLTGNSKLFLTILRMHFFATLLRPTEGISSRTDIGELQHESDGLAWQAYDRLVPDRQRCRIEELNSETRLEKLKDALQCIRLVTRDPKFNTIPTYLARVPQMALALPDTMREIVDLRASVMLRTTAGEADAGVCPAAWLVKHLWDRAVRAAFLAREERRVLESRVTVTEQGNLRVDAHYVHWSLTRRRLCKVSCDGSFTAVISQPGLLTAVLQISEKATRPLTPSAVAAFMLANTIAFDGVKDVFVSSLTAEQPFDRTLVSIEYNHDDGTMLGFGWPLPDTALLFDIMLISAHWKVVMGAANPDTITMPQLAVFFLDVMIETANKRDPGGIKLRLDLETATNVWEDLARKLADLGKLPATKQHPSRELMFVDWASKQAGLLAAPESGLPPTIAELFLDNLRQAVSDKWPSVAAGLREARRVRARHALRLATKKPGLDKQISAQAVDLLKCIDSKCPDSPWKKLVGGEAALSAAAEAKVKPRRRKPLRKT